MDCCWLGVGSCCRCRCANPRCADLSALRCCLAAPSPPFISLPCPPRLRSARRHRKCRRCSEQQQRGRVQPYSQPFDRHSSHTHTRVRCRRQQTDPAAATRRIDQRGPQRIRSVRPPSTQPATHAVTCIALRPQRIQTARRTRRRRRRRRPSVLVRPSRCPRRIRSATIPCADRRK